MYLSSATGLPSRVRLTQAIVAGFRAAQTIRASEEMNTSNLNVGRRLEELDRQIHTCLKDIRKNLKELEQVSGHDDSAPAKADKRFSTLFKAALQDQDPPSPE